MNKRFLVSLIVVSLFVAGVGIAFTQQTWDDFLNHFLSLSPEEQGAIRSNMTPEQLAYLDQLLAERQTSQSAEVPNLAVQPDPGNLTAYRGKVGQTFRFLVTGSTSGSVWGTDVYTDDSHLATAAVHAGVLREGEKGVVTVTILPGRASYEGSTRFGVTSKSYGAWSGSFQFEAHASIPAGVPVQLTYTVTVRNLSGVPVVNPVVRDNGKILNNDEAVKTGGNQDNVLEVGETWTWTYQERVVGTIGGNIVNTATVAGPDDANLDTDPSNNSATVAVAVTAPPVKYDLSVTKTVTVTTVPEEEIEIGETREKVLNECNLWQAAQSGGYLGTEDIWDISAMPVGTSFDLRFNTYSVPDRLVVEYPVGVRVLDTGWRGEQSYIDRNPQLYPGGLSGSGQGQVDGVFVKGQANTFKVIVYGPEKDTAWDYEVRGNCP